MKKITYLIMFILYLIIIYKVIDIRLINNKYYQELYEIKSNNIVYGQTARRGKILDTNGNILVDNIPKYNITYRIIKGTKKEEKTYIANKLIELLSLDDEASINELKDYYIRNNDTTRYLSEEELDLIKYHKISKEEEYDKIYERIDKDINYTKEESILIHTLYLMNKGYLKDTKIIQEDVSIKICSLIEESSLNGVSCEISWKRKINYPIIESILGNINKIPLEDKDYYHEYVDNDLVGVSGLEKYYDQELKGTKAKYEVLEDNTLKLIEDEKEGNDLILALDINVINKIYEILDRNFKLAKTLKNTKYFNETYVIVSNPKTNEIVGILGLKKDNDKYIDITSNTMLSSFTLGSIVKGASHTVGYLNNLIEPNKKILDSCVKLYNVPAKCSFKRLGYIDDISALKMSSNYYQFITAIKSTGNTYKNNMLLSVSEDNFNIYRNIFKKYGLGSDTYIDFLNTSIGIEGKKISGDLLLNLSIGQYDTYTPMQVMSYINTIANYGKRYSLSFKKKENTLVDEINLDKKYYDRIIKGFYEVVNNGTGRGYTNSKYKPVGKTGTSQTFLGSINTITSSYVMYAPIDDPKYSMVVITPNVSYYNEQDYLAPINRLISKELTEYLFDNNK